MQRIALYSHDALGLGHMRRNLALAGALVASGERAVLVLAGAHEAGAFPMPSGVDCLALPALAKTPDGVYASRSLPLSLDALVRLRAETIRAALERFEPDVLIVDKKPLGAERELEPTIRSLRRQGTTRLVLGLRDVLDAPEAVRREWAFAGETAIRRYYDAVWVYGDRSVYDPVAEYGLSSEVAAKVRYTGYLDPGTRPAREHQASPTLDLPAGRLWLCLVGGGEDGYRLADAFVRAAIPPDVSGVVVTGPFMPPAHAERIRRAAGDRVRVIEFVKEVRPLLARAERVVAMGGYNTVCELLSLRKRALVVPRLEPRTEQLIRAERMRLLGLLDLLHPRELDPLALSDWLGRQWPPPPKAAERIDLAGLARVPQLLDELLADRGAERRVACAAR